MLRFVLEVRTRDSVSGCEWVDLHTVDAAVPGVEERLWDGGIGEAGFKIWRVVGVEVRDLSPEVKYAAPPAAGPTLTDDAVPLDSDILEAVAAVVYEAMLTAVGASAVKLHCRPAPPWVPRGNSLAQDAARDAARKILRMKPPAAGLTLTDLERWSVEEGRDALRGLGREIYADQLAGLLARAAKEGGR